MIYASLVCLLVALGLSALGTAMTIEMTQWEALIHGWPYWVGIVLFSVISMVMKWKVELSTSQNSSNISTDVNDENGVR